MSSMRYISRRILLAISVAAAASCVIAVSARAQTGSLGRIALSGYDPVSYFTAGHPEKGSAEFPFPFDDTTYLFASEEHRKMFAANLEKYAPQFDGYCALGVSTGLKVEADPEAWTISNGKLFVFASKQVVSEFRAKPGEIARKANAAWVTLKSN